MKYILITILLLSASHSQDFSLYGSFGVGVHIEGSQLEDISFFETIDDLKQKPSVSDFFSSGFLKEIGFSVGLFDSDLKNKRRGHFLIGFNYYFDSMTSLYPDEDGELLGRELDIRTSIPYLGYAFYRNGKYKKGYYYVTAGPAFSSYEGSYKESGKSYITKYESEVGYFIGGGFLTRFTESLALDIGASFVVREVKPISVERPDTDEPVIINSSTALSDNSSSIKIGLVFVF